MILQMAMTMMTTRKLSSISSSSRKRSMVNNNNSKSSGKFQKGDITRQPSDNDISNGDGDDDGN
eukprot:CAMPEP_0170778980 /NCGR_PEP_ID=MMETSP0733-20121128/12710_1 /TAXON_ID=186038 /ORGANISM="Fragilariopsis kerguelensis, Strain L26-C5" /LENGTH=63 /DNA_ID=CAMNT_0011122499 /DNA_START=229 /DNA_END=420 /DNA_ORIENTATION=+